MLSNAARLLLPALLAALLALGGCSSGPKPQSGSVYVMSDPPERRVESRAPRPATEAVWIQGQWRWNGYRYVWLPGYWEVAPRGSVWVPGRWHNTPRGWVWVYGHWQ